MRQHYLAVTVTFFVLMMSHQAVQATGNVLLPPTDGSNGNRPVINPYIPEQPKETPDASTTTSPTVDTSKDTTSVTAPSSDAQPQLQYGQFTPIPGSVDAGPPRINPGSPTTVVAIALDDNDPRLPHRMDISVDPSSRWSQEDLLKISRTLSYAPETVQTHCYIAGKGYINSDINSYGFLTDRNLNTQTRFDGTAENVSVFIQSMCDMLPLPPNLGNVIQIGDKYAVGMTSVSCPIPGGKGHHVVIQYAGDNLGRCVVQ